MKVFISQPMRDKTRDQIFNQRKEIENYLITLFPEEKEITALDSWVENYDEFKTSLWYLGQSISIMAQADIVYLAPGWSKARGCLIEELAAVAYGIPIINGEEIENEIAI